MEAGGPRGWSEREKGKEPPAPSFYIAHESWCQRLPLPNHSWVLSLGAPTSDSPLGLSSAACECHLYPTSPAECLALPPSTSLEAPRFSTGVSCSFPLLHGYSSCLPGSLRPAPSGSRSGRLSREQDFQNATSIL